MIKHRTLHHNKNLLKYNKLLCWCPCVCILRHVYCKIVKDIIISLLPIFSVSHKKNALHVDVSTAESTGAVVGQF